MRKNLFVVRRKDLAQLVRVGDQPQWLQEVIYHAFSEEGLHLYIIDKQLWITLPDLQRLKELHAKVRVPKEELHVQA